MADSVQNTRPKSRSILSHGSRRSSGSAAKVDLTESPRDKKKLNLRSDPSQAINEAQPAAVALEESSLESIRAITWKDSLGNVIADPDRSNPTRSRLERPLDTIRAFEAAVDGTYSHRRSTYASGPASPMLSNGASRRNSQFGFNGNNGLGRPQNGPGYYQNGRSHAPRPRSFADDLEGRYHSPSRPTRHGSSPMLSNLNTDSHYAAHGHQPSYDTITTAAGSYGTDTRGYSTDPSSHNSSVDRFPNKTEEHSVDKNQGLGYAHGPYSPFTPNYNGEQNFRRGANGRSQAPSGRTEYWDGNLDGKTQEQSPTVSRKEAQAPMPIKLNSVPVADTPTPVTAKRQSWFQRRFSKKN